MPRGPYRVKGVGRVQRQPQEIPEDMKSGAKITRKDRQYYKARNALRRKLNEPQVKFADLDRLMPRKPE